MISIISIDRENLAGSPSLRNQAPNFEPNTQEYDVATLQLNDDGELENSQTLNNALQHIKTSRKENKNGVIVVLFAHGWHHGSAWDDSHFVSFRKLLANLCLREAERYDEGNNARGRRVFGIYLAWNGDPDDSWLTTFPYITNLTFWDRYKTANKVGAGNDLYEIVRLLIQETKSPLENGESDTNEHIASPLIISGHSMGAILIELAFLSVLKANEAAILDNRPKGKNDVIALKRNDKAVLAPDLILALNSAADSEIAFEIKAIVEQQKWQKIAEAPHNDNLLHGDIRYNPPILVSMTSTEDSATGRVWRYARPFHTTDGHNPDLFTHTFTQLYPATCNARGFIDFGQSWHCVRRPQPAVSKSPNISIDLPIGQRQEGITPEHMRYKLLSNNLDKDELAWIFQIPGEICEDHNDIFNPQMGSLVLALIQVSGAVMSLANEWTQTFEPK